MHFCGQTKRKPNKARSVFVSILTLFLLPLVGCNTYRVLPSHGGGKRFDQEQRVVVAALRNAVAQMDLTDLEGKNVNVSVISLAHNGGGYYEFPGFTNLTLSRTRAQTRGTDYYLSDRDSTYYAAGYKPNTTFRPTVFGTDQDLTYLTAAVEMKVRHEGVKYNPAAPQYTLFVLVDVFGTDLSRQDSYVAWEDRLKASCELSYYALDLTTNKLLFTARRCAAQAVYRESSIIAFASSDAEFTQKSSTPTFMALQQSDLIVPVTPKKTGSEKSIPFLGASEEETSERELLLRNKLKQADSYIQSRDITAAERLLQEIRIVDPDFEGLKQMDSRLQAVKLEILLKTNDMNDSE